MERARLSTKGQIVIPARMRRRLKLKGKEDVLIDMENNAVVIRPMVKLSELRGVSEGRGPSVADLLKEREEDMRMEGEHEYLHKHRRKK